jgi:membrane-bound lytic murein transglycosylase D
MAGRPILAAAGLFIGGLMVGSVQGAGRDGTAYAANPPAPPDTRDRHGRERGPIAPSLQKLTGANRYGDPEEIEPPVWGKGSAAMSVSRVGAQCATRTTGQGSRGDVDEGRRRDGAAEGFGGLKMPDLHVPSNPQVQKYIRYFTENHEGRKTFLEALRRSGRYQEVIAKSLRELGLPQELIAVAFIESGFSTEAVSTAGAVGLWQFMPSTARAYGLTVESSVDERVSIWRSTEAAAHHLSDLYQRFRSWELALAAYNLGFDGLQNRLDDFDVDDFWTLAESPGALPKETAHYVPKVLAAAMIFANLEAFGFASIERAAPVDATELDVPGGTSLALAARAAGTSLRTLRDLNPELLSDVAPKRGATWTLHVPPAGLTRARTMLPRLAADGDDAAQVSEDFDWGKDDLRTGSSRLERTATRGGAAGEPRVAPHRRPRRSLAARIEQARARLSSMIADAEESRDKAGKTTPSRDEGERAEKVEKTERAEKAEKTEKTEAPSKPAMTRVLYRVVAGDSVRQIAATVGLTVDQVLAQAHVGSPDEIKVGTLLDLRVASQDVKTDR